MKHLIAILLLLFSSRAFPQDSTQLSGLPTIYTVHIDEVMLSLVQRFEQLNTAQVRARSAIFEEHKLPLTPVYELSTSSGMYMSLRAKTLYGDLDKSPQYPDDVKKLFAVVHSKIVQSQSVNNKVCSPPHGVGETADGFNL